MTYVVTENCIKCKYMDCVEVCPVDCFYEGANMLVIHPDECIDCGVCEPECPAEAIKPDTEPDLEKWMALNAEYAQTWPNVTIKRDPPADAKEWDGKPGKLEAYLLARARPGRLTAARGSAQSATSPKSSSIFNGRRATAVTMSRKAPARVPFDFRRTA